MSKRKIYRIEFLLATILMCIVCFIYYYKEDYGSMAAVQKHMDGEMITFSEESGFYDESITVSLVKNIEVPDSASIYYTLDGDDPTIIKTKYTGAIQLDKKEDFQVYPLKAVVYYDETYSEIYEKTYVLCNDLNNGMDVDVVCITSDSNNLYNYETGIMVAGKTFDDEIETFEGNGILRGNYSNRGEEWIRNAHVTLFDQEGMLKIEQNIGLGISGGTSAEYGVKSLKLYAGSEYDKHYDKFNYNMTNEELKCALYSFVNEYNSIRLRAGSQDMERGNIRSSIVSRLVQLSEADSCTATKRCIVYLNGEYYGLFDMQQNYSDSYLADRFGLENSEDIEKYKGSEAGTFSNAGIAEYFNVDLNDSNNQQVLEKYVDMDNYLLYYAINVLCNNTDWPDNNFEIWRYAGEFDSDNQYSDGRYRFLIYDTDMIFNTDLSADFFAGSKEDTLISLLEKKYRATRSTFSNVMSSTYYRNKFIIYIRDLLNTSFSEESITNVIRDEDKKIDKIRKIYYEEEVNRDAKAHVRQILNAAKNRSDEIENVLENYFGLYDKYEFYLETSEGMAVKWNNMCIFADQEYNNQYYKGCEMILDQDAYPGYKFQYWLVNGEKVYDTSLTITGQMILEDEIHIQAVAENKNDPEIIISELSAKGRADWIRVKNVGNGSIGLKEYYISDDEENLMKYQLPDISLESGESVIIYGSRNQESLGDYICNFSLNKDEKLFLSNRNQKIFCLSIPKMSDIETYGRCDDSNIWKFFMTKRID